MKAPAPPTPEIVDVKRLNHLPLVGALWRELAVKDILDALIPPHARHEVTVGECIEARILTILTGEHALSPMADTLAGYDLEVIFQRPMEATHFRDNCVGCALEALWAPGRCSRSSARSAERPGSRRKDGGAAPARAEPRRQRQAAACVQLRRRVAQLPPVLSAPARCQLWTCWTRQLPLETSTSACSSKSRTIVLENPPTRRRSR